MKILLSIILLMSLSLSLLAEETKNGWNLRMPEDNASNSQINNAPHSQS